MSKEIIFNPKLSMNKSKQALLVILLFAFLLRLITGFSFPNILWPDEIFQTLEQGHRLAFGNGIIPWEFREGIRSWLLPGVLGGWMKLTDSLGNGSIGYIRAVIFLLSLLSLIPVWIAFAIAHQVNGLKAGIVAGSICAIWFESIYFSSKALTEVIATYPLLIAVYLGFYQKESLSKYHQGLIGFLYGITVILRLHYFPAVVVALILQSLKFSFKNNLFLIFGFLSAFLIGGILDAFTWNYPFQSLWKNIKINLFDGVSNSFGTSPWYQYLSWMLLSWSLFVIVIIFLCILTAKRHFVLVNIALTLVIVHSLIAHKEYRFMAGAIQIIIILSALGTAELVSYLRVPKRIVHGEAVTIFISLGMWIVVSFFLASRFDTDRNFNITYLLQKPEMTHWTKHRETLLAFQDVSKQKDVCGVGVAGIHWAWSGGYTHLHQDVPLHFIENNQILDKKEVFNALSQSFNYFMVHSLEFVPQGFELDRCYGKMCIYKRPPNCQIDPTKEKFQIIPQPS